MNLINDPWIPVRRADGTLDRVEPWRITDFTEGKSAIVAIASPRPDFDGALSQFLIGLLQTICTPENEDAWWDWRGKPPAPDVIRKKFAAIADAFYLNRGDGALFMQERLTSNDKSKPHPISYLLIGAATDSTQKQNIDHFQKRLNENEECLCPACAATALYTLQAFAPSGGGGGEGKFTGIRGGGPLTTLILGQNLWETAWLNTVSGKTFSSNPPSTSVFPWLNVAAFITDRSPVKTVHSDSMDARHVFWGMPRRIYLEFSANEANQACVCCGEMVDQACLWFRDRSGGLTYQQKVGSSKKPSWIHPRHPLSPYNESDDNRSSAVHPQPGGIGYRHWLGLVENSADGNTKRLPATVIEQFRSMVREDGRFWAFGYEMDNMKARCWYESTMPILYLEGGQAAILGGHLANMVKAARYASGLVMSAVLKATLLDATKKNPDCGAHQFAIVWKWPKDLLAKLKRAPTEKTDAVEARVNASGEELEARAESGLLSAPLTARTQFWSSTEPMFFQRSTEMRNALVSGGDENDVLHAWRRDMVEYSLQVFRFYAQVGDFDAADPRRAALAQYELEQMIHGQKLRNLLGLP